MTRSLLEAAMALLNFRKKTTEDTPLNGNVEALLKDYSIEVMPRTAEKVENFKDLLPVGTRVYIAHIEGTPIEDMVATAKRLNAEGYPVMPHFPARIIQDQGHAGRLDCPLSRRSQCRPSPAAGGWCRQTSRRFSQLHAAVGNRRVRQGRASSACMLQVTPKATRTSIPDGSMTNVDRRIALETGVFGHL